MQRRQADRGRAFAGRLEFGTILDAGILHVCQEDAVERHLHVLEAVGAVRGSRGGESEHFLRAAGLIGAVVEAVQRDRQPSEPSGGALDLAGHRARRPRWRGSRLAAWRALGWAFPLDWRRSCGRSA